MAVILALPPAWPGPAYPVGMPRRAGLSFPAHLIASPFGTIHAATFRFPQPVGTEMPTLPNYRQTAYAADGRAMLSSPVGDEMPHREFPEINRRLKGARLVPRVRPDFHALPLAAAGDAMSEAAPDRGEIMRSSRPSDDPLMDTDADDRDHDADTGEEAEPIVGAAIPIPRDDFASAAPGMTPATAVDPWPKKAPASDPLEQLDAMSRAVDEAARARTETIAAKGEVTGAGHRPRSPAELLGLTGAARARQQKCLANAIYFEARGEPVRGQMAVAQVVINRVFSGYYPSNICGVVYQSTRRHRHRRCQFSFTCDGIPDRITEPDAWARAKDIAREALDGDFWLNDIGKATHYHARWVHPRWVREMRRLDRIGVHTFYRPRKWGDGAGSPVWGDASAKL